MRVGRLTLQQLAICMVLLLLLGGVAQAQIHDLEMEPAPDITAATNGANWHSPDIKLGADFGDASVPDIVRRGAETPIFAKFYINGVLDYTINSPMEIYFYYREATVGVAPPEDITDASWVPIGTLTVPYNPAEPFFIIREWPTDFPSVTTKSIAWTPPEIGNMFHVRAQVVYPGETPTTADPTDEDPEDNYAVSLYESILGVRDVDLVIVHDVSGSMLTNTYEGDTYLDHAKSRAIDFVLLMSESHKLGVVAFGGCLTGGYWEDIWDLPAMPLEPATLTNKVAAVGAIGTNVTVPHGGCGTPLGEGVQRAIDILAAEPVSATRKRAILLLSDGWENMGTPRACDGADPAAPCLGESILSQLETNDIRLFSVALGNAAGTECLECLANNSDGSWYAPAGPGIELAAVYADMQQAYSADDLYRSDTGISGGGNDTYSTYFEGVDDLLYFSLQTDRLDANLELELQPPGGGWMAAAAVSGAKVFQDRGYFVVRVEMPEAGTWGYRVVGEEEQAYLVIVRSDKVATSLRIGLRTKGVVGAPLRIRATLKNLDEPINDADLVAMVQLPGSASFETLMRALGRKYIAKTNQLPLPVDLRKKSPDLSPRALFLQTVGDKLDELYQTKKVKMTLKQVGPGLYGATLGEDTKVAGEYKVTVKYQSKKADRTWTESVRLQPGRLDPRRSFAELAPIEGRDGKQVWFLRVYPADSFGNAIVSREVFSKIEAVIDGGKLAGRRIVAFDSTIQQPVAVGIRREPVLRRVTVAGQPIPVRRYNDLSQGDRPQLQSPRK